MPSRPIFAPFPLLDTTPFPLLGTAPFLPSPLHFLAPFSHSLTPALFRRPLALRHRSSPTFNTPLPFGTVQPNKTERKASVRSCLAKRRAFVRACLVERRAMTEQREEGAADRKGGKRWGLERAGARELGGARKEQMPESGVRVLGKGEEMGGRGAVPERKKGAVPERRRAQRKKAVPERRQRGDEPGGHCWGGEEMGATPKGEEETGAGVWREKGRG